MAFGDILKAFNQSGGQPGAMQPMQSPVGMPPIDDKASKNQKLGLMLYALGGALKGDKNFVQNTMALEQMQEGKKKKEERNRLLKQFAQDPANKQKMPWLEDVYTLLGDKAADTIADNIVKSYSPISDDSTESERTRSRYLALSQKPNLNQTEKLELRTLETDIFGNDLVPFFDKNRIQRATYTSAQIGKNPEIITQMEEQGLFSVGAKSAFATAGAANPVDDMAENWLTSKSQLNAINDLARLNYENRDSFTLAGSLADLVNTGVYQLESARRLGNLNKFADLNPEEYAKYNSRIDSLLNDKYGNILNKISEDRAVAKSIFLKLAYSTAKEIDPSGRLSDNDVKIAMDIIGQLGANWKANIAVLENLAKTSKSNYIDRYNMQYNNLKKEADITKAKQYADLPQFLGGIDWRNEGVIAPASLQGSQLRIDPEIDKLLKNQGI